LHSVFHFLVAGTGFVCMFFLNVPFPIIIIGALLFAFIARKVWPKLFAQTERAKEQLAKDEDDYFINQNQAVSNTGFQFGRFARQLLTTAFIWVIPIASFYFLTSDFPFWKELSLFFTRAAFVTFGGAYAVLPYVAQVSVEELHWLTELQMIDGLALGETTPGPLVMVLVFVGFMAGFNQYGGSVLMGSLGLVTTTFFTFVPCFFFIFAGAPIIEKTRENAQIKQALTIVTAAVVGVILNLTIYLGKAVVFPKEIALSQIDFLTLGWIIVSFVAMYRFKINMIAWIGISSLFGLITFLLGA
jgi:chromate transporter